MRLRVRSIFTKIFLWFTATLVLSFVGYLATSVILFAHLAHREPAARVHSLFVDDARRAYEEGGPSRLQDYLARLDSYSEAGQFLLDSKGREVKTFQVGSVNAWLWL